MSDDDFRDPDEETSLRIQDDKETLGVSSSHDPPPWTEGEQLSDFVLEKLLGVGSSGFVYRALDVKTNRRCALKLLKHSTPDDLLRNKLGFRRMMSLAHPNLLRVDRIYQLGSYIALSMEEVDGVTFKKKVRELKKLEPEEAYAQLLKLLRDYASGLAMMHAHGFIHRDIKPENLMVDADGNGRVIDYGLVDSFELDQASFSARGFLLGTPHYFAPEVLWSQRYLPAGDIFSLGIVMLDALRTLRRSRKRRERESVERSKTNQLDDAERIDDAIQELPDSALRDACAEMLERHPSDRSTAMELSRLGLPPTQHIQWPHEEPIVGRREELEAIQAWLGRVFDGEVGRLHLTGPSGIGKTRLIDDVIRYIESKNWGQVFFARCRLREDQPLQAFDQLCDAITNRYMMGDREKIELDPVSGEILQNIFPVLKNIITSSLQLAPAGETTERLDALEAAARMSEQLRLVGPLFLIIDDSQWADRDSLNVLDRLQSAIGREGLGIITVSRQEPDPQRVPATLHVALKPLKIEDSVEILAQSAKRWSVDVSDSLLRRLAETTNGSPLRLRELAGEFRPGGALAEMNISEDDTSVTDLLQIDQLWQKRSERLSNDAKRVLLYVVTAGDRVSTQQLGELTGLGDSVDAAISELARQRLIIDEATGGDCIMIFHDHVADQLINMLSDEAKRKAHHAWASMLARQDQPETHAARIARHFFSAGEPGRAVAHAILAAEDAERHVAMTEAARWYARVVDFVDGDEQIDQLRNAARCYCEADFPVSAADMYLKLAKLVGTEERIQCQLHATVLLIRCGRFSQVRGQLRELAETLGLPRPKSPWRSQLALLAGGVRLSLLGNRGLIAKIAADSEKSSSRTLPSPSQNQNADASASGAPSDSGVRGNRSLRQQQRLNLCLSLVRPMSMFDNLYAAELSIAGTHLALKHGDVSNRIHVAVGQAVFGCYDGGKGRIASEKALMELKDLVAPLKHAKAHGDVWAGIAFSHALACRWDQVSQPVTESVEHYRMVADSSVFEIAHTQWIDLWASSNLGRWDQLLRLSDMLFDDATRRNDLFQQIITTTGFGSIAWLARDKTDELERLRTENARSESNPKQVQMLQLFDWIASMLTLLYQGNFQEAWSSYESMQPRLDRMPYRKMQMMRVSHRMLGALTALHNYSVDRSEKWVLRTQTLTHRLRREKITHAVALANFYDGLWRLAVAQDSDSSPSDDARRLLMEAQHQARGARLRPIQLAAEDALAVIHTGQSMGRLADRMKTRNVARPEHFRRLYTVLAE